MELSSHRCQTLLKDLKVTESVLDAIKNGQWDYEPEPVEQEKYDFTSALPGTDAKLSILAHRASTLR